MKTDLIAVEPDPQRDHQIYQCLVSGFPPFDVAVHFGVPLEYVLPIRDELPEFMRQRTTPAALRKEIALARTDMAIRSLMPDVEKGDHEAIEMMLKVQKREAAMTGLDAPIKSDATVKIVIDAPWMSADRLSYNRQPVLDVTDAAVIETAPPNTPSEVAQARAEHEAAQIKSRDKAKAIKAKRIGNAGPPPERAARPVLDPDPPAPGTARAVEAALAAKEKRQK